MRPLQVPLLAIALVHAACGAPPGTSTASSPVTRMPVATRSPVVSKHPQSVVGNTVRVNLVGDRVTVSDLAGRVIIASWAPQFTVPSSDGRATAMILPATDGFDVLYTVRNIGTRVVAIDSLPTPVLQLASSVHWYDFEHSGWSVPVSAVGTRRQASYPNELYSPVSVLVGGGMAVGVTVQYPLLQYKHDVSIATTCPSYGNWRTELRLGGQQPAGDLWWANNALVPAGETFSYTVSYRFGPAAGQWQDTLLPYRDYFRRTYGPVSYVRQATPIRGLALAAMDLQTPQNPNGWSTVAGSPDRFGYRTAARAVQDLLQKSSRVVVWAPSGLAYNNRALNYPPQFVSRWLNPGVGSQALRDGPAQFRTVRAAFGQSWGFWWGHAAETSPGWDTLPLRRIDPNNASHRAVVEAELQVALDSGAQIAGLDAFAHCHNPVWNLVALLDILKRKAPYMTFCTEGRACDVLHRLAPTWIDAYAMKRTSAGDVGRIKGPFHLADLIVPGHETWAGMCYDRAGDPVLFGANASSAVQTRDIQQVIQYGYVPVTWLNLDLNSVAASLPKTP